MKSDVENLSPTRVKISVDVPFEDLAAHIADAYKTIAQQVNIPGFRKGKVPARIIDQRFGRGAVLEEAVNAAIPDAYSEAIKLAGIVPVSRPDVDVTELNDGQNLVFTAEVDIRPDFTVPDLSQLSLVVDSAKVTADDVAEELKALRDRFATLTTVDRGAAVGDTVVIDIAAKLADGTDVPELNATGLNVAVGDDDLMPGLAEAITGAPAGEVRTFDFVPEAGKHADQPVTLTVTVEEVRERELPAEDDEFAQLASQFDTIAELTADLERRVAVGKRLAQQSQALEELRSRLLELVDFPLPEALVAAEVDEHLRDGHGDAEHRAAFEEETRERLRTTFLLDKLAEDAQVEVSQAELTTWLMSQAPRYQMSPEQFADALVKAGQVDMAVAEVKQSKALEWALTQAVVTDQDGERVLPKSRSEIFQELTPAPEPAAAEPVDEEESVTE